jgi:L-fucose mutarotase
MLKTRLLHPDILAALGRAGHGAQVLIADGNYPFSTKLGSRATLVSLNLSPGLVNCAQVLEALVTAIPIEAAAVMATAKSGPHASKTNPQAEPEIWSEFLEILKQGTGQSSELQEIERFQFYEAACSPSVALTIATGDQRLYANLLLTIGVVFPKS